MASETFPDEIGIAFAMHCDANGLSASDVRDLADEVTQAIENNAEHCIEQREAAA